MYDFSKLHIFCDFDGTITDKDSLVFLTQELGGGIELLRETGKKLRANEMTVRDAIELEMHSIHATFTEARALMLSKINVDPDFKNFVNWSLAKKIPFTVLSAGFHEFIELFVPSQQFPQLEILASHVIPQPNGWQCDFRDDSDYGNDKAKVILEKRAAGYHTIFIGDGLSDRASAAVADTVFAKSYLAVYCREQNLPFVPFETFADLLRHFQPPKTHIA